MAPARIERVKKNPLKHSVLSAHAGEAMDFIRTMAAGNFTNIVYFQSRACEEELGRHVARSLRCSTRRESSGRRLRRLRKLPRGARPGRRRRARPSADLPPAVFSATLI